MNSKETSAGIIDAVAGIINEAVSSKKAIAKIIVSVAGFMNATASSKEATSGIIVAVARTMNVEAICSEAVTRIILAAVGITSEASSSMKAITRIVPVATGYNKNSCSYSEVSQELMNRNTDATLQFFFFEFYSVYLFILRTCCTKKGFYVLLYSLCYITKTRCIGIQYLVSCDARVA